MSVSTFVPEAELVTVTAKAQRHFEHMLEKQGGAMVRLSTKVSGCSGYAYVLNTVDEAKDTDEHIQVSDKLTLLIAADAIDKVRMTEIDYVQEGINGVIKFNNPNVVSECGCGESFNLG